MGVGSLCRSRCPERSLRRQVLVLSPPRCRACGFPRAAFSLGLPQSLAVPTAQPVPLPGTIWTPLPGYSSSLPTPWSPVRGKSVRTLRAGPIPSPTSVPSPATRHPEPKGAQPTPSPAPGAPRSPRAMQGWFGRDPRGCALQFERLGNKIRDCHWLLGPILGSPRSRVHSRS